MKPLTPKINFRTGTVGPTTPELEAHIKRLESMTPAEVSAYISSVAQKRETRAEVLTQARRARQRLRAKQ